MGWYGRRRREGLEEGEKMGRGGEGRGGGKWSLLKEATLHYSKKKGQWRLHNCGNTTEATYPTPTIYQKKSTNKRVESTLINLAMTQQQIKNKNNKKAPRSQKRKWRGEEEGK